MSQFFQTNFVFIFLQQKGTEKSHKKNSSRSKYSNQETMEMTGKCLFSPYQWRDSHPENHQQSFEMAPEYY